MEPQAIEDLKQPDLPTQVELSEGTYEFNQEPQSPDKIEYVEKLHGLFNKAAALRQESQPLIGDRSFEDYWNDSQKRWLGILPTDRPRWWQSRVVKPVTRNKSIGIIANLLSDMIAPEFYARDKQSRLSQSFARAIRHLFEFSRDLDRAEEKYLRTLVDCVTFGTAFVEETYARDVRQVKFVTDYDPTTGKTEFVKKMRVDFEGFRSDVVSPYDLYLGDIFCYDLQEQPFMFRRTVMPYKTAESMFGHYPDFGKVPEDGPLVGKEDNNGDKYTPYPFATERVVNGEVEIIQYYCKQDDEYLIIANGILLNDLDSPFPYNHKNYPFAKVMFEPLSSRCTYGKSLPDRLMGEQDVLDTLYRMIIDKTYLSIFPPTFSDGSLRLSADVYEPGAVIEGDPDAKFEAVKGLAQPIGNEMNVLGMVEGSMENASIDNAHLGRMASGERSATQVLESKAGAQKLLGLFAHMVMFLVEDCANLRGQNILQFWTTWKRQVGDEEVENMFEVPDRQLKGGRSGSHIIRFLPKEMHPEPLGIRQEEDMMDRLGKPSEITYIDPDAAGTFQLMVRVKANPTDRLSPLLERAMANELYTSMATNERISKERLTREVLSAYGKDPDEFMQEPPAPAPQPGMEGEEAPARGPMGQQLSAMVQPKLGSLLGKEPQV